VVTMSFKRLILQSAGRGCDTMLCELCVTTLSLMCNACHAEQIQAPAHHPFPPPLPLPPTPLPNYRAGTHRRGKAACADLLCGLCVGAAEDLSPGRPRAWLFWLFSAHPATHSGCCCNPSGAARARSFQAYPSGRHCPREGRCRQLCSRALQGASAPRKPPRRPAERPPSRAACCLCSCAGSILISLVADFTCQAVVQCSLWCAAC